MKNSLPLTQEEVWELLEPIRDHYHAWGAISRLVIAEEVERRKCKKSKNLKHSWVWPRLEDSLDQNRGTTVSQPYCENCLCRME